MLSKLEKFKNFIGYNNENDKKEEVAEAKKKSSIETKKESEVKICDCCNEQEITIEKSEMFKINEDGEKIALFEHPKVTVQNGGIYDDVAICDNCFSTCETDEQKQYVWIFGKMNSIHKEILAKEEIINQNNNLIEQIRLKAENEMRQIAEQSNAINAEINSLSNTIELYAQEQAHLESQFQ